MKRSKAPSVFILSHESCGRWSDFAGFPTRGNAVAAGQNHTRWFGSKNKVRKVSLAAFVRSRLPFIEIRVPRRGVRS